MSGKADSNVIFTSECAAAKCFALAFTFIYSRASVLAIVFLTRTAGHLVSVDRINGLFPQLPMLFNRRE
jgi:hypothetical protein